MGQVKKFGPSSTLILRRNWRQKRVRAQCAPPAPLGLKKLHPIFSFQLTTKIGQNLYAYDLNVNFHEYYLTVPNNKIL